MSEDGSDAQAKMARRQAIRRGLVGVLISYALAYIPFGAVLGFASETLALFLVSTVVVWISSPWAAFDVYANVMEGKPQGRFAGVDKIHWPSMLTALWSVGFAVLLGRGYWSLAFWMLAGASTSYCLSRMLVSAYDRGRLAGRPRD